MTKREMANDIVRVLFNHPRATDADIESNAAYRRHRDRIARRTKSRIEDAWLAVHPTAKEAE